MYLLAALTFLTTTLAQPEFAEETIFPANPKHNHGSSIVETPEGDLLACWFHGSGERKEDDVLIQGARKRKGADTWSEPFVMADTPNLPDCNPVLFIDPRGTLWLFWIAVQDNEWGGSLLKYRTSTDYSKDGAPVWNWQDVIHCRPTNLETKFVEAVTEAEKQYAPMLESNTRLKGELQEWKSRAGDKLAQRIGWMTRLHPIMTSDNRMMLGLYSDVWNCSLAAFTEDWGGTWTFSEPIITFELGNIQPAFARRANGEIAAFMRDNGIPKKVRTATSKDDGKTWGPVTHLDIPNPGSSVECTVLKNGHWVLVCNDANEGRHILTAYLSEDEGKTWPVSRRIENFEPEKGSGSYPSLIQANDRSIHCSYSYTRSDVPGSTIKHVRFHEEWIRAGQ
ncbi:MAG: exo-alpha-sialidase [Candidatus Hydrogenedentes bacterium]|nr:exo-alpha-sialidase [Candidatus Hydrogenedentota bacterium]